MSDIRYMNSQMPYISVLLKCYGIIQILCILTVYCNGNQISEILSSFYIFFKNRTRNFFQFIFHIIIEFFRETESSDYGKYINSCICTFSKNFNNLALRLLFITTEFCNLNYYLISGFCTLISCCRNINIF